MFTLDDFPCHPKNYMDPIMTIKSTKTFMGKPLPDLMEA